ncbi:MAG TPA: helix-turn-helix transcriptional regulator [Verrucomicrobiae bacterium]|jgi:transcriptional regulator with XRE-family HTH domain|nr:helix-turn-helix transcriptional regulator [Verrucomicrobiae bacterium]
MNIGHTLRRIRESKHLSQGDVEKCTGLLRCYISRVENGHTVPAIETLEKIARGLEMPLYQVFYEANDQPPAPAANHVKGSEWGSSGKSARYFHKLVDCLSRMDKAHRLLLFEIVKKAAKRARQR